MALYRDDKIVAVTGFMPMITLYNGRFIWVCDLVTEPSERSKGYGEKLLSYVHQWSEDNGYKIVSLSSGLQCIDAHRFYEEKIRRYLNWLHQGGFIDEGIGEEAIELTNHSDLELAVAYLLKLAGMFDTLENKSA